MTSPLVRLITILSLVFSTGGAVQAQTSAIRILVYATHQGSNIVYHYTVVNNSDGLFSEFTIGSNFDSKLGHEIPQLDRLPAGWTYGRVGETGTEIILAPDSTTQPSYWTPWMYGQQDISLHYLNWSTPLGDGSYGIAPGQTLSGFSVTLASIDRVPKRSAEMYLKGNFKVSFGSKKNFQEVWGALEQQDTTAPTISLGLSPSTLRPRHEKLIPIAATILVKDDYDPAPEIKLESITANEPLDKSDIQDAQIGMDDRQFRLRAEREGKNKNGRIYTVTYSATDASGNKSTVSATVTVPHDDREKVRDATERKD